MNRLTLLVIFIVIIIVLKLVRDTQFTTLECNKKYSNKPGLMECPSKCNFVKPSEECSDGKCDISYSCTSRNIYRKYL